MPSSLSDSTDVLAKQFDVALLDLDGVAYVGAQAVPGAAKALASARDAGMRLAFVTNNAARPPAAVAAHLSELGITAEANEVITSAQAAAHYLSERLPAGAAVLVVGTTGLVEALHERGLRAVFSADDDPQAVVQGYSPDLDWKQLAEGAVAIRNGVTWVATNLDATVPSPRGPLPGNGSLVAALKHATGATPTATGKPDPTMHRESVQRSGARRPIVVGDRLDTDIEGATAVGCPSLLVLSGVTTPHDLLGAPEHLRPNFLAHDVSGLLYRHRAPAVTRDRARCGPWTARAEGSQLVLAGAPDDASAGGHDRSDAQDDLDPLRALCGVAWSATRHGDDVEGGVDGGVDSAVDGAVEGGSQWQVRAEDEHAAAVLRQLGLD